MQQLGERLIELNASQLAAIQLDPELLEAVQAAQKIRTHGALRRQKQLIGKIMRRTDPAPISSALQAIEQRDRNATRLFKRSEQWRDRIVDEGKPALEQFFSETGRENDELTHTMRAFGAARDSRSRKHLRRSIFRVVHQELLDIDGG